jgi:hypothetical protein
MKKIANFLRLFWGCVFLAGVVINIVIGFTNPHSYDKGGLYAWPDFLQNFWAGTVAPHMAFFIILFAVLELALGLSILSKGKWAGAGIVGAVVFGLGLLMLGLGAGRGNWAARTPNLVFEAMMLYCLFFSYDKSLWETVRRKKELTRTAVIGS